MHESLKKRNREEDISKKKKIEQLFLNITEKHLEGKNPLEGNFDRCFRRGCVWLHWGSVCKPKIFYRGNQSAKHEGEDNRVCPYFMLKSLVYQNEQNFKAGKMFRIYQVE